MGWNDLAPWQQGLVVCMAMLWVGRLVGQLALPLVRIMEALERAHPPETREQRLERERQEELARTLSQWRAARAARNAQEGPQEPRGAPQAKA